MNFFKRLFSRKPKPRIATFRQNEVLWIKGLPFRIKSVGRGKMMLKVLRGRSKP